MIEWCGKGRPFQADRFCARRRRIPQNNPVRPPVAGGDRGPAVIQNLNGASAQAFRKNFAGWSERHKPRPRLNELSFKRKDPNSSGFFPGSFPIAGVSRAAAKSPSKS